MISKLHDALKAKKISSTEITKHYLSRIKADKTNSYITVTEENALASAKKADEAFAAGRAGILTGIPVGLKDLLCTKGVKTTCASKILGDYKPPYNATTVDRLEKAGTVSLGKLNMDEFAMGGSNENSAFGPVKNPVNLDHVAGGSSGGSVAAVKAGLAVATLGSDTGGSIRLPASFCGVVGLKPTYGVLSRYGLVAFASSLDQIGPVGVDTEDCAIMLSEMSGHDPCDTTSYPKKKENYLEGMRAQAGRKLTIGLPKEYYIGGLQKEVQASIDQTRKALEKQGHKFVEISLPHTEYSVAVYYIVAVSEASSNLARFDGVRFGSRLGGNMSLTDMYKKTRSQFGAEVKRRILLGTYALSAGYYDAYYKKACQVRNLIKQDFDKVFGGIGGATKVDAIMAPTAPTTAYKLGAKTADPLQMYLYDIFTIPVNLAGLPGISTPIGRDQNGLPIGVQFIGPHFSENTLLAISEQIEKNHYKEEVSHGLTI